MKAGCACRPAIAQLEERRFVIGNRSKTTLGPVFESRWLDPVLLPQYETQSWRLLVIFGQHHARRTRGSEQRHSSTILGSYMLISMSAKKVQPAIAQLEERRFVIGNRSLTTLGPVFESRWLDIFTTSHIFLLTLVRPVRRG